jgi:hypothetical protein
MSESASLSLDAQLNSTKPFPRPLHQLQDRNCNQGWRTNWHRTRRFRKFYGQTGPILSNKKREKSMPLGAVFVALFCQKESVS